MAISQAKSPSSLRPEVPEYFGDSPHSFDSTESKQKKIIKMISPKIGINPRSIHQPTYPISLILLVPKGSEIMKIPIP